MGLCDRTKGECTCVVGFSGGACERMNCAENCFGHGQCITMQLLAEKAKTDRGAPSATSYGATANTHAAWDYDSMQGCYCDEGYMGYDCTLRTCPYGDDPLTRHQQQERQQLWCNLTSASGTFRLGFKDLETVDLPYNADEIAVKAALEALDTVGKLEVSFVHTGAPYAGNATTGGQACSIASTLADRTWMIIRFLTELGDTPDLTFSGSGGVVGYQLLKDGRGVSQKGSRETTFCSNRGLCDHSSGTCTCFHGFASSDGLGGPGNRGDCGHVPQFAGAISAF
jgi:hypothetical protein